MLKKNLFQFKYCRSNFENENKFIPDRKKTPALGIEFNDFNETSSNLILLRTISHLSANKLVDKVKLHYFFPFVRDLNKAIGQVNYCIKKKRENRNIYHYI